MSSSKPHATIGILEEIRKVSWPTKQEALKLTIVVIIASVFVGLYIGFFDIVFAQLLSLITR